MRFPAVCALTLLSASVTTSAERVDNSRVEVAAATAVTAINSADAVPQLFGLFSEEMRKAVPLEKLRSMLASIRSAHGRVVSRRPPSPAAGTVVYPLAMERGELELVLAVDSAGQIAGLLLQPPAGQFSEARFEEIGSRLEAAIRADDAKALGADFSESTEKAIPESSRRNLLSQLRSQFGKLKERKAVTHPSSNTATWRLVYDRGEVDLKVALDQEGKIAGIWFLPSARAALSFAPPLNTVCLRLPFRGMWMALWGGETAEDNAHHDIENQRYAIDWVGIDDEGRRTRPSSAGLENEDFLAYGREILAPSSAEVTDVIDGVRDNLPGSMNPYSALGNSVTLRLARDQFAVLAHLQPGSIRVRPGQRVEAGEVVGLCGNSGESSEPHLHFHIQHTPILQDGVGVRSFFETVVLLSTPCCRIRSDYSPVRWDVVLAD